MKPHASRESMNPKGVCREAPLASSVPSNPFGDMLVNSWINCMLFMLELVLAVRYFQQSSRPLLHRAGVSAMIAGPPHGFPEFTLQTTAVIICSTFTTASLAKLFLCALYFNLTKRRVISAILLFGIVVELAFSYASAVLILATGSPYGWAMLISTIGAISSAVTDSMIAAALLYIFIRMDATSAFRASTHNITKRLICVHTYLLFFYSHGRVYALTILGNFAVGVPAQHTPTTTPKLNTITGAVFPVKHTSADDQAVTTCDRAHQSTLLRPFKC
ncbi:hypothetical protein B0H13DRAFT_2102540 [Mycena leptocephala]|nr:hypothetical protein B0H13DRAFT_2102540 [Mycena leptocephala]